MKGALPALAIAMLMGHVAQAARLIVVLPLDTSNTTGKLKKEERVDLEEMLRDTASDALTSAGWTVLTGETTLQVLQDNGVDASKCGDQNCHLSMAREFKAEKFLSGNVRYVEGSFTASIRLIDTETGRILASQSIEGDTVKALRKDFRSRAADFFAKGGLLSNPPPPTGGTTNAVPEVRPNGPKVTKAPVAPAVGTLTITARPKEAVRLDVVDPDGKKSSAGGTFENKAAKPGTWKITASGTGYEDETQEIEVASDDVTLVKFDLKPLGGLSVTGTPAGAAVSISGPGQFHDEGGLPWEATGLRRGKYTVKVERAGYATYEQSVEVAAGGTARVEITLQKQSAKVAAAKSDKCRLGKVLGQHGVAFYEDLGSNTYLGRVANGGTFELLSTKSDTNPRYPTLSPLIHIKVLTNEYSSEIGKSGYIDLDETDLKDCVTRP